jgi:hypothetical protein
MPTLQDTFTTHPLSRWIEAYLPFCRLFFLLLANPIPGLLRAVGARIIAKEKRAQAVDTHYPFTSVTAITDLGK